MSRLRIWEKTGASGEAAAVWLEAREGHVVIGVGDAEIGPLPREAIDAVLDRFGKPLEDGVWESIAPASPWLLGGGAALVTFRYLARYDVIARDWIALERPGKARVAALAVTIAGALEHLAAAARRRGDP